MPPTTRLILHVDINKTIIISDAGQGTNMEDMINSLLTECVWGVIDEDAIAAAGGVAQEQHFTILCERPSALPLNEKWCSMNEFLEQRVKPTKPYKKSFKFKFTLPGQLGERFRPDYEELLNKLELPDQYKEAMLKHCPDGRYHILPSFFKLCLHMHSTKRPDDWAIVFRTFGEDILRVADEWNLFCSGTHPMYPRRTEENTDRGESIDVKGHLNVNCNLKLDGSDGGPDRRVKIPYSTGEFYRHHCHEEVALALVGKESGLVTMRHGYKDIYESILQATAGGCTLALRDFYPYWHDAGETNNSGKLLLISGETDRSAAVESEEADDDGGGDGSSCITKGSSADGAASVDDEQDVVVQILLDDNIERDTAHIADCREAATGQSIPFSRSKDVYLARVEPLRAIMEDDYLIGLVEQCERRQLEELLLRAST